MITSLALCPHPPLLFRELGGLADPVAALRAACAEALREALADPPDLVVVVGGADEAASWDDGQGFDVRRFGTTGRRTGSDLPLSLGVGRRLLDEGGWAGPTELVAVGWDAPTGQVDEVRDRLAARPERVLVLLLGEGSARRGLTAPGFLDERAFGFDDALAAALASGDAEALSDLDGDLARDLMVEGRAVFRVMGALAATFGGRPRSVLDYRDDPFGLSYFVAHWTPRTDRA